MTNWSILNSLEMQKLKLEFTFSKSRKYCVHVGHMQWLEFETKRFVQNYLREYKKLLMDNIRLVNNIYSQSHQLYRLFYFELDDSTCFKLENINQSISERWSFVFKTFSEGNQNAFVFGNIEKIMMLNEDFLLTLKNHAQKYKNTSLTSQINPLIKQLEVIEKSYMDDKLSLKLNTSYQTKMKLVKLSSENREVV